MNERNRLQTTADATPATDATLDLEEWKLKLFAHIGRRQAESLAAVLPALNAHPTDPELLLLAALAALLDNRPDQCLRYQHRFTKRFRPFDAEHLLLQAIALAQQERWTLAYNIVRQHGANRLRASIQYIPCGWSLMAWLRGWVAKIERAEQRRVTQQASAPIKKAANKVTKKATEKTSARVSAKFGKGDALASAEMSIASHDERSSTTHEAAPPLPRISSHIPVTISLPDNFDEIALAMNDDAHGDSNGDDASNDLTAFSLRHEITHLGLLQGFDELLCLTALHDVEAYWYQQEAVRKVLKQFRGRVLLADEVGLGKTVEAGMVLKEYLLRGMARRVLILTPATLVGQWQEEMHVKFGVDFATSYDALLRNDPSAFWSQERVIASIATARRAEHFTHLAAQVYDLVIVDEAHHLKNRQTQNWKLVNALHKRFLLLLSATPVQNSLVELYNLLTLLKPGIFKTEKEFRASYIRTGKPRVPANREQMRDLMRDVMIRNTRSLVEVRLPARHAVTMRLEPEREEAECYQELSRLVQQAYRSETASRRLALRHLLSAAGSNPATAARAIERFVTSKGNKSDTADNMDAAWRDLAARYEHLAQSGATRKEAALLDLLSRNREEKKIVFVHHRETLERLTRLIERESISFARFDGTMSGVEKDAAIERFRAEVPLLLSTESGGEGRNLQFCNTLINFDLPWNPMAIEQRIGRIHRIGQEREVFIFNTVVRDTLEEQMLRILDEKINMFELVVGEIDQILGAMDDDEGEFAEMVFAAWVETTETERGAAFDRLGERLIEAKSQYEAVKSLDEELFGDEFVAG